LRLGEEKQKKERRKIETTAAKYNGLGQAIIINTQTETKT